MVERQHEVALPLIDLEKRHVEKFIRNFLNTYLLERNVEKTAQFISDNFYGIGLASNEVVVSRNNFSIMMQDEKIHHPQTIPYKIELLTIRKIEQTIYECAAKIEIVLDPQPASLKNQIRFSCNVKQAQDGLFITMIHVSRMEMVRNDDLIPGVFLNGGGNLDSNAQYDLIHMMCHIMPGGILGVNHMEGFPIYVINDHMLEMLGYEYDEFMSQCRGMLINAVHKEDQLQLTKKLKDSFLHDQPYEVEYRLRKKDGRFLWVYNTGRIASADSQPKAILTMVMDITHTVEVRNRLRAESERDSLTNLYNRKGGETRIRKELEEEAPYIFLLLDIDNFKKMNDCYGHYQGDQALCFLAQLLTQNFRKSDIVYRIGGDEFGLFLTDCKGHDIIRVKLEELCRTFQQWSKDNFPKSEMSVSLGGIAGKKKIEYADLYQMADRVLYQVKNQGKGYVLIQTDLFD